MRRMHARRCVTALVLAAIVSGGLPADTSATANCPDDNLCFWAD
jgi:hypothetical protein